MDYQFPTLHEKIFHRKTDELLEKVRKIVPPDYAIEKWAKSFHGKIVESSLKPVDSHHSIATVVVK